MTPRTAMCPHPQAVPKGIQESIADSKSTVPWCLHTRVPAVSVQTQRQSLRGNHILAAMPKTETVDMPLGQVVFEPGGELQHAYFPLSAIVSLLCGVNNGESAEIAPARAGVYRRVSWRPKCGAATRC